MYTYINSPPTEFNIFFYIDDLSLFRYFFPFEQLNKKKEK